MTMACIMMSVPAPRTTSTRPSIWSDSLSASILCKGTTNRWRDSPRKRVARGTKSPHEESNTPETHSTVNSRHLRVYCSRSPPPPPPPYCRYASFVKSLAPHLYFPSALSTPQPQQPPPGPSHIVRRCRAHEPGTLVSPLASETPTSLRIL